MKKGRVLSTLFGIGLLGAIVAWIGPGVLVQRFAALKWAFPLLLASGLLKHLLRTLAWKQALDAEGVVLPYRELLRVRLGSQGVAYLSSMGLLVSEPMKPWLLRKLAAVESTIPATLVEAGTYWFTSLLVTTGGLLVILNVVATQQHALLAAALWTGVFGAAIGLIFARTPLSARLAAFVARRRSAPPRLVSGLHKAVEMESQVRSFRHRRAGVSTRILGINALVQVVMFAEVWVVLSAIGVAVGLALLAAIEAASRVVKMLSFYLPGRVGADEAGAAGAFALLGMPASAGLTLAIARRAQGLVWAAVGIAWLSISGVGRRASQSAAQEGHPVPTGTGAKLADGASLIEA